MGQEDYFEAADQVLMMREYVLKSVTTGDAKAIGNSEGCQRSNIDRNQFYIFESSRFFDRLLRNIISPITYLNNYESISFDRDFATLLTSGPITICA